MRRPPLIPALAAIAAIAVAGIAAWQVIPMPNTQKQAVRDSASAQVPIDIGGAFEMTAHTGETVTDKTFEGKLLLVFFGYTFCPDVCPTTLNSVALALDVLGDNAASVQPLFITVDPARDTPEVPADYAPAFHPSILGLSGTPEQTARIAKSYRAFFAKAADSGGDPDTYLMDHSVFIYLMGRDGKYLTMFSHTAKPEDMAAEIARYLKQDEKAGRIEIPVQVEAPNAMEPATDASVPGEHVQGS